MSSSGTAALASRLLPAEAAMIAWIGRRGNRRHSGSSILGGESGFAAIRFAVPMVISG
jgi:hypothetical protein